jgi:predicted DNA-binding transcriptional regulator AlpA
MRVLSFKELKSLKGIPHSRQHVGRLVAQGKFPSPITFGAAVGFVEEEIDEYLRTLIAKRDAGHRSVRARQRSAHKSTTDLRGENDRPHCRQSHSMREKCSD